MSAFLSYRGFVFAGVICLSLATHYADAAWPFGDKKDDDKKKSAPGNVIMPPAASARTSTAVITPGSPGTTSTSTATRILARPHMRFTEGDEEKQLMTFINARRRAQEDFVVVSRLMEEKKLEVQTFNQQMKELFGVDPDLNYQFDADKGMIFELVMKTTLTEEQKKQPSVNAEQLKDFYDFNPHRRLADEQEKTRFMRLAAGKQLATEQIRMLSLLQNEKEIENTTLHEEMARRYSISIDREYRYDNDSKTLFELVVVPADYKEPTSPEQSPVKQK